MNFKIKILILFLMSFSLYGCGNDLEERVSYLEKENQKLKQKNNRLAERIERIKEIYNIEGKIKPKGQFEGGAGVYDGVFEKE